MGAGGRGWVSVIVLTVVFYWRRRRSGGERTYSYSTTPHSDKWEKLVTFFDIGSVVSWRGRAPLTKAMMMMCVLSRVVYQFGIFGRYSVGISPVLPIPYRRKTRSVHFGIKKGAVPPFFLRRGAMAPFLRTPTPFWKKGGRKGGKFKKGGNDTDRNTENPANLIPAKYNTKKTAGNTVVSLVLRLLFVSEVAGGGERGAMMITIGIRRFCIDFEVGSFASM
jgi:hypothetical protein